MASIRRLNVLGTFVYIAERHDWSDDRDVPVLSDWWLERVTGIEPVTEAWEAFVIPFHHTRN